ncbi:acylneuraminate cytidylyltransferase [Pseudoalteromonas lipolytica SCSIO 04301]|uniref:acylneuraminate cytidylyltransferase family protein n=1 Tax=Pseudoalteromonas lipolytica TaxID=570156 RepID=UPI00045246D0|nr:acylneuraminate cytidylyltransferase family protein [Pseudoalteromonas lipolytica]EWH06144.1 acylneuraminate cytidylyltransferase [Pseudoalteromonas lipolytica SCSIO 04301]
MFIALITARGGSKGLPKKNTLLLNNKPVISWTIEAALQSNSIEQVYVSTEDDEIKRICKSYKDVKIIDRPLELASDTASSEEVIWHAYEYFTTHRVSVDTIALLQPTSPLRIALDIDNAYEEFVKNNASMVLSVFEPSHSPIKAYILNGNGQLTGLYNSQAPYTRRQDLPSAYQPNGAIYIFSCSEFIKEKKLPRNMVFPYIMSQSDSIDLDSYNDLKQIEKRLGER